MKKSQRLVTLLAGLGIVVGGVFFTESASAGAESRPVPKDPTLVSQKSFSTTSLSQTLCWTGVTDEQLITWYGAPVTASQPVVASASEGVMYGEGAGDAHVYAENTTVLNSAIQVRVHTGWGAPLNVCVHYVAA
ncbi:hypothetical protein ACIQ9Q_38970 [Streptomyces sp. NPDC094438]|uniref:hypothetical protein n=1 Tax=Streptomyces sp. NPDC094438 TaxID=3366061 RepID=UPI00383052DB